VPGFFVSLLQWRADRAKTVAELGANTLHSKNDRESDAGCDQAVFDGGGAAFVFEERRKAFLPIRKVRAISQKLYSHSQPRNPHSVW
jgi:hypothetical protein